MSEPPRGPGGTATPSAARTPEAAPAGPIPVKPHYRPEVQGLRAFAVLMVVTYHVWLGRVSGGVDVFLLISAFLLTSSFAYKLSSGKPIGLLRYWLHRFKSLLPAAVVVLLAVLAGTAALLPRTRWGEVFEQTWSTLFYTQNWTLARESVDYYAENHGAASPLQHFWSLSIQGQVFILWPLLIGVSALLWKLIRRRRPQLGFGPVLAVAFGLVFVGSLAYSIHVTSTSQSWAYFDTGARLWEFALGSLLAVLLPHAGQLPMVVRVVLGWAGLLAMLSCGILLQVQQQFPGYIALWPTLSAAAIIIAGRTGHPFGVDRLLAARPLTRLGDLSYALYLWHWPLLVIYLSVNQLNEPDFLGGLGVIGLSLGLAWATTRVVETPFHGWVWPTLHRRRLGLVVGLLVAIVAMPLSGWQARVAADETSARAQPKQDNPGAASLTPGFEATGDPEAMVRPLATRLSGEWANYGGECGQGYELTDPVMEFCQMGGDPQTAEKTIIVLGDSHAQHWTSALDKAAQRNNWAWVLINRNACRFGAEDPSRDAECNEFNQVATDYVLDHDADAVLTLGTLTQAYASTDERTPADEETIVPGYEEGIRPFLAQGKQVIAMRDTPRFGFGVPECVDLNGPDSEKCQVPRDELIAVDSPLDDLRAEVDRGDLPGELDFLDMTSVLCPEGTCSPVIGNVLVYLDKSHLTKTYVRSTSEVFERRLKSGLHW
ncbi:MAG: acyltransferase [Micrococcaceae bacterium]|uniref:acyltransferase family protein n=1 Tax=Arthrobacter sp. 179 TaxID=3457734 RepID=UPI00264DA817|nr:acyltransferase [Micrococcaceae bacterium]MDN5905024.1 acyltransferase [Micrococcaceae bacterium]MDN6168795.1 acyltransferase [Micrococcaceae bacterium]MDN6298957.1 acyltransferase [Micrococcaceae bacterium]